jgi:hypothetical protein
MGRETDQTPPYFAVINNVFVLYPPPPRDAMACSGTALLYFISAIDRRENHEKLQFEQLVSGRRSNGDFVNTSETLASVKLFAS